MGGANAELEIVLEALDRLDVDVRCERCGGGGGGLCILKGKKIVFIDLDADEITRLECALQALACLPGAETIFLPPATRERVDRLRKP
ncbi:MAG: hypothetical protein IH987_17005 [Planctomycetes bacterium]|nr:hypothetical protein [Planctomycetota bacterium]